MRNFKLVSFAIFFVCASELNANAAVSVWIGLSDENWGNSANWSNGTVPLSPGQSADISSTVNVDVFPGIDSLSMDGSGTMLNILPIKSLTVSNWIINNGTITVDSSDSIYGASLAFSGSATLSGSGIVLLNNPSAQLNTSNANATITQAAGHTINGQGTIEATLLNQGLINANVSGGTLSLANAIITNTATLEATGGGLLRLLYTNVNNAGGTILASGGNIVIGGGDGGGLVDGGTMTIMSASSLSVGGGGGSLNGVSLSLASGSQFNIPGGQAAYVTSGTISNNGTITVGSDNAGNGANIVFSGSPTLLGSGNLVLNRADAQLSGTLTQAAGHTISGQGTINATLLNQGLIDANVNGGTLFFKGDDITNTATLEATGGGLLTIQVNVNNAGGTILASGGNIVVDGAINGGTFTVQGASILSTDYNANLNGVSLSLASGSQFNIPGGNAGTVTSGTILNNGTITVGSGTAGNGGNIGFNGNATLLGSGSLVLNRANAQLNTSGGTLTQAAGHTISGQGTINATLLNQGLIDANVNGGTLFFKSDDITNTATLEATGGGLLTIQVNVNNAGGTILASGGNIVVDGAINGGTFTVQGASILSTDYNANLNGVSLSLASGSQFNIPGGNAGTVTSGTILNNGTITVGSGTAGNGGNIGFNGNATLLGSGSLVLNRANAQLNGTLTQAAGHTISGQGTIRATLLNEGLINANVNGGGLAFANDDITNAGTIEATGGGLLAIDVNVNNAGGTILASGGNIQIDGAINGGTLTVQGTSILSTNYSFNLNGVSLSLAGGSQFNIPGGNGATITSGTISNDGTITVGSGTAGNGGNIGFNGNATLLGSGSLVLNRSNAQLNTSGGTLTQAAGHTISGQGTINAALNNLGTVEAEGGTLTMANQYNPENNSMTVVDGTLVLSYPTTMDGMLTGAGILRFGGTLDYASSSTSSFAGTLAANPGASALEVNDGTLILSGGGDMGATTVNGGRLVITSDNALLAGSSLTIGSPFSPGAELALPVSTSVTASLTPVPEPGSFLMLSVVAIAGVTIAAARKYRRT